MTPNQFNEVDFCGDRSHVGPIKTWIVTNYLIWRLPVQVISGLLLSHFAQHLVMTESVHTLPGCLLGAVSLLLLLIRRNITAKNNF